MGLLFHRRHLFVMQDCPLLELYSYFCFSPYILLGSQSPHIRECVETQFSAMFLLISCFELTWRW